MHKALLHTDNPQDTPGSLNVYYTHTLIHTYTYTNAHNNVRQVLSPHFKHTNWLKRSLYTESTTLNSNTAQLQLLPTLYDHSISK